MQWEMDTLESCFSISDLCHVRAEASGYAVTLYSNCVFKQVLNMTSDYNYQIDIAKPRESFPYSLTQFGGLTVLKGASSTNRNALGDPILRCINPLKSVLSHAETTPLNNSHFNRAKRRRRSDTTNVQRLKDPLFLI